jgi:hypothetical protein
MRDPLQTVPSQLSSLAPGLRLFGHDPKDPAFRDRMLSLMEFYYANLLARLQSAPGDRAALVSMDSLKEDLEPTLAGLYRRLGIDLRPGFAAALAEEGRRARDYATRHHYRLGDFALDAATIRRRFAHVYERFSFSRARPDADAADAVAV